jgi:hypothetical protein
MIEPTYIYLNSFSFETPKCPVGFTIVVANRIVKPIIYPADSIVKVSFCNMQIQYAVVESLLKEKIGELPEPELSPKYKDGVDALKKYFKERPLTINNDAYALFRVTIAFVVDCNGKAGNFFIISKGTGIVETYANQIVERVNKMPQKWQPAMKNGKAVDCYQTLSFIVMDGKLDNVAYK